MAETPNIDRSCISRNDYSERGNTGPPTTTRNTPKPKPKLPRARGRSTTTRAPTVGTALQSDAGATAGENGGSSCQSIRVNSNLENSGKADRFDDNATVTISQKLDEFDQKKKDIQSIDSSSTSSAFKPSLLSIATTSHPADNPNEDLPSTAGPSACSASELAATIHLRHHSVDPQPINDHPQLRFNPIVRIIPNPDEENSSDEENHSRRSRSRSRRRPVRLCTKKIALPLNISTSSLIGIGHHHNHSNASLTANSPSAVVTSRELFAQTRKEIDEDEQFIPDVPRYLNLTLPSITRQPNRRALRREEKHRLERWKQMGGNHKSNLKPSTLSNLHHLSPGLRERLNNATVPVQLSTNTAINSIASSISPNDDWEQQAQNTPFSKQVTSVDSNAQVMNSEPVGPISPPTPVTTNALKLTSPQASNSVVDQMIPAESKSCSPLETNGRRISRFKWFGQKARSVRLDRQQNDAGDPGKANTSPPAGSIGDSPGASLQKSPTHISFGRPSLPVTPDQSLQGAPLKRVSTPRVLTQGAMTSGAPLQRTATPTTPFLRPSATPLQDSSALGASLEKSSTPGAALQRSATTGTRRSKPTHIAFFKKLTNWRKTPPPSNHTEPTTTSTSKFVDDVIIISANSPPFANSSIQNLSNVSLMLAPEGKTKPNFATDKWGSKKEVPLRECCQVCLSSANIETGTKP
ncbi:hypothetical protein PTTG_06004 [Puccinia triticina 1-1 BBBD Race 1]|uniref:Uncharacterized protein n=1 Tax=Puccinia triticina (isolate 1-1 / race 1 (BBBD)) TaxID=630390 RepID=A0A180GGV4_PUCT1|nr:hypothetical protein PTTG_06004 [Puccinia triticina 1-1 BBBD Race 1]